MFTFPSNYGNMKTISKHHFPVRMAKINQWTTDAGGDVEKREPSFTAGQGMVCHGAQLLRTSTLGLTNRRPKGDTWTAAMPYGFGGEVGRQDVRPQRVKL